MGTVGVSEDIAVVVVSEDIAVVSVGTAAHVEDTAVHVEDTAVHAVDTADVEDTTKQEECSV